MIQRPYTLATLPVPLNASHGKILAADIHSLSGPRKRKRPELAVAVDNDGINIYSVFLATVILLYNTDTLFRLDRQD